MTDELRPDPEIAAALRRIEADPPLESVDWDRLHSMIVRRAAGDVDEEAGQAAAAGHAAAAPALRSPRRPSWRDYPGLNWLDYTAHWARAAIPITAVITIVLAFWLHSIAPRISPADYPGAASFDDPTALSLAVSGEVTDHDVIDAVTGPTSRDWLRYNLLENHNVEN